MEHLPDQRLAIEQERGHGFEVVCTFDRRQQEAVQAVGLKAISL